MFDTLHLYIRGVSIPTGFDDNKWQYSNSCKQEQWKEKLFVKDLYLPPSIKQIKQDGGILSIKISSLLKFFFGHNLSNFKEKEVNQALDLIDNVVKSFFIDPSGHNLLPQLPSIRDWNVNRADFSVNIHPKLADPATCLRAIRQLNGTHNLKPSWMSDETVYFQSKAKHRRLELVFYNKELECKQKQPDFAEQAKGILRFEVRFLSGPKIREYLKLDRLPILQDLLPTDVWSKVFADHLSRLSIKPGVNSIDGSWDSLEKKVSGRRAVDLYGFRKLIQEHGRAEVIRRRGKSWVDRRDRWLREAGLMNVVVEVPGILEEVRDLVNQTVLNAHASKSNIEEKRSFDQTLLKQLNRAEIEKEQTHTKKYRLFKATMEDKKCKQLHKRSAQLG